MWAIWDRRRGAGRPPPRSQGTSGLPFFPPLASPWAAQAPRRLLLPARRQANCTILPRAVALRRSLPLRRLVSCSRRRPSTSRQRRRRQAPTSSQSTPWATCRASSSQTAPRSTRALLCCSGSRTRCAAVDTPQPGHRAVGSVPSACERARCQSRASSFARARAGAWRGTTAAWMRAGLCRRGGPP